MHLYNLELQFVVRSKIFISLMLKIRVCLKNAAGDENAVFGFWISVPF